jgi:hypothetical protein
MERYYLEWEGPLVKKYRNCLIPFALKFYQEMPESSFQAIKEGAQFFKSHYHSKNNNILIMPIMPIELIEFKSKEEYIDYYERRLMESDNLCRETKRTDCLL